MKVTFNTLLIGFYFFVLFPVVLYSCSSNVHRGIEETGEEHNPVERLSKQLSPQNVDDDNLFKNRGSRCKWINPRPQGNKIYGIAMMSEDLFVVVGGDGASAIYNHGEWYDVDTEVYEDLTDVYYSKSINKVFAISEYGRILYLNNNSWIEESHEKEICFDVSARFSELRAVHGNSGTVYVASGQGRILRYRNKQWVCETSPVRTKLDDILVFSSDEAVAVGYGGVVLTRSKSGWQEIENPTHANVKVVCGTNTDDFYIGCEDGSVYHRKLKMWQFVGSSSEKGIVGCRNSSPRCVIVVDKTGKSIEYCSDRDVNRTEFKNIGVVDEANLSSYPVNYYISDFNIYREINGKMTCLVKEFTNENIVSVSVVKNESLYVATKRKVYWNNGSGWEGVKGVEEIECDILGFIEYKGSNFLLSSKGFITEIHNDKIGESIFVGNEDVTAFAMAPYSSREKLATCGKRGVVIFGSNEESYIIEDAITKCDFMWWDVNDKITIRPTSYKGLMNYENSQNGSKEKGGLSIVLATSNALAIWGSDLGDIYTVGARELIYHYGNNDEKLEHRIAVSMFGDYYDLLSVVGIEKEGIIVAAGEKGRVLVGANGQYSYGKVGLSFDIKGMRIFNRELYLFGDNGRLVECNVDKLLGRLR